MLQHIYAMLDEQPLEDFFRFQPIQPPNLSRGLRNYKRPIEGVNYKSGKGLSSESESLWEIIQVGAILNLRAMRWTMLKKRKSYKRCYLIGLKGKVISTSCSPKIEFDQKFSQRDSKVFHR
ncbi:uncharacterized protein LOC132309023 [Cornus florida]|uniref:uncharacterized protein LOC132309023 n=1 Tax=Cornus florida TaxID=4283 RepID=UPI00289A920C|nr:uncharacterized protein LOC132309023 [Cornus florida]